MLPRAIGMATAGSVAAASDGRRPTVATVGATAVDEQARDEATDGVRLRATIGAFGYHRHLPFTLPTGVRRLRVSLATNLPAAVGIGLFDPRGAQHGSPGFRGVAGVERDTVVVALDAATPGFLAGPLPAGRWTVALVVLGAIPITTATVDVRWERGDGAVAAVPSVPGLLRPGPGWYAGDLHCHTEASSDAWSSGRALSVVDWAAHGDAAGLDFLAMTDHNTISQNRLLHAGGRDVLLLAGEEMTSWFHGHAIVAGLPSADAWLDWRLRPAFLPLLGNERRVTAFFDAVRSFGAFAAPAHPFVGFKSWQFMLDGGGDPAARPDGIEVWNGGFTSADRLALRWWDRQLRRGNRVTAVGGSDLHERPEGEDQTAGPGTPTTIVGATDLSPAALVAALKAGRVTLSSRPDGPRLHVEAAGPDGQRATVGGTIHGTDSDTVAVRVRAERARGAALVAITERSRRVVATIADDRQVVDVRRQVGEGGHVRFELRRGLLRHVEALANPVWIVNGRPSGDVPPEPLPFELVD